MAKPIAVLGAGAWGTALALYLSRQGFPVRLWSVDPEEIRALTQDRSNKRFLPGFEFPELIHPTHDLKAAIDAVEEVVLVVPSVGYRSTLQTLATHADPSLRIISATKGFDKQSGKFLNEVAEEILPSGMSFGVLSGPSFAKEVAASLPTAVIFASHNLSYAKEIAKKYCSALFRIIPSNDLIGTEIGGIAKNVAAIAIGMVDGLKLGSNARAALLTLSFEEAIQLGVALGGKAETFCSYSGIGDLVLTSLDDLSRNRRFGLLLGQGNSVQNAEQIIGQAIEGKNNVAELLQIAKQTGITLQVAQMVHEVIQGRQDAKNAFFELFNRIA